MELLTISNLLALLSLTLLEIVLGVDNIIFISILVSKLEHSQQAMARQLGLIAAMVTRILLLLAIGWVMKLTEPLFAVLENEISGRDLIMLIGGLFLIAKATHEIHDKLEMPDARKELGKRRATSLTTAIIQIGLIDIIFSLDSVITAVGMAEHIEIMIAAVVIAVGVMMFSARAISEYIEKHPTLKMLALSFLLLIGVMLVADGLGQHVNKAYIYFALAFSLLVEVLNIRAKKVYAHKATNT